MTINDENPEITEKFGIKKGDNVTYTRHAEPIRGIVTGFWSGMVCLDTKDTDTGYYQGWPQFFEHNVKEHAPLSAGASVDHGVEVGITADHVNRAADRGCCVSSCSPS